MIDYFIKFFVYCGMPQKLASVIVVAPTLIGFGWGAGSLYSTGKTFFEQSDQLRADVSQIMQNNRMLISSMLAMSEAMEAQKTGMMDIVAELQKPAPNTGVIEKIIKDTNVTYTKLMPHNNYIVDSIGNAKIIITPKKK